MVILDKGLVDIEVLKYTGFYQYLYDISIEETDDSFIITCPTTICGYINTAYEDHVNLNKEYSQELIDTMVTNASVVLTKALDDYFDNIAKQYRYDNMASVRSYAGFDNPFQEEALKLSKWCADCWVQAGIIEQEVLDGDRAMPTLEEVLAEFPDLSNY